MHKGVTFPRWVYRDGDSSAEGVIVHDEQEWCEQHEAGYLEVDEDMRPEQVEDELDDDEPADEVPPESEPEPDEPLPPRRMGRWSKAEDQALRDGLANGTSFADICAALGRSERSVEARADRLGHER